MGNCSIKGTTTGECHHTIRVLSDSGAILQFKAPKTVGQVLQHHPGYGIFLHGHASSPLPAHQSLSYALFYYLLPLKEEAPADQKAGDTVVEEVILHKSETEWKNGTEEKPNKPPCVAAAAAAAASDYVQSLSHGSALEVLPSAKNGVWRVKLVIETRQLEEILSEQGNTEALIEKMRRVAATTACSGASPTRSTWKVGGWKPPLWSSPLYRGRIAATSAVADSNLGQG